MKTLAQFRENRKLNGVSVESFTQLLNQWISLNSSKKLTVGEDVAYSGEARIQRDVLGLEVANKIMDEIFKKKEE